MKKIDITWKGETKKVSFTDPQARIIERLLNGEKYVVVNRHRMSGGDFIWYDADGYSFEYVGVRAWQGAMFAIRKAFGCGGYGDQFFYGNESN